MLTIPGRPIRTCEGWSRRELMRVGGAGLLGLNLPEFLSWKASAAAKTDSKPKAFGAAKSVIMLFLQGGPSHIDIWDPKPNAPSNVRGDFKAIKTKVPGIEVTEVMPMLADQMDKVTLIRSMSYTPVGLFNHTAAIYQMMTGYPPDKVSPSGQLEPPSPRDFPHMGCHISKMKPPEGPMLPFVDMPRPLQESNVIGKGGSAGFLGKAFDPYTLFPEGDDLDMTKMDKIKVEDLKLPPEVFAMRLERRARLRDALEEKMPEIEKATAQYN